MLTMIMQQDYFDQKSIQQFQNFINGSDKLFILSGIQSDNNNLLIPKGVMQFKLSLRLEPNSTHCKKKHSNFQLQLLLLSCLINLVKSACNFNINCDIKCLGKMCEYDPSTNSYYNSSISNTSAGYHGQGCCTGCAYPYNMDHIYDSATKSCFIGACGKDSNGVQQYWSKNNSCGYQCNGTFKNPYTGACENLCSSGYYAMYQSMSCLENCPFGFYKYMQPYFRGRCQQDCFERFANNETGFCQQRCTTGYADNFTQSCVHNCSNHRYKDNQNKLCVEKRFCGLSNSEFANDLTKSCQKYCSNDLFGDPVTNSCLSECPPGYFKFSQNLTVDFQNLTANLCVTKPKCNNRSQMSFINKNTQKCESSCSGGLYGDHYSGYCVDVCPSNSYRYQAFKVCLESCDTTIQGITLVLNPTTSTCQSKLLANQLISLSSSSIQSNIVISQTAIIIVGVILTAVIAALVAWNIYLLYYKKQYARIPIRTPEKRIDVDFNL